MAESKGSDIALKPLQIQTAKNEERRPLTAIARQFHEPDINLYVLAIIGSKTEFVPDVVKANIEPIFQAHPYMSSLQVVDNETDLGMKWIPTKVEIDNHIIVPKLEPADMDSPDKFVEDYISNLSKTTIDNSKPLWDIHILNVKTSDAQGTVVFRCHHSLGDGMSLMSILLSCTRKVSDPNALPTMPTTKAASSTSKFGTKLRILWNSFVALVMFVLTSLFLKDTQTPLKATDRGVGRRPRRIVRRSVSLHDIKLVKNETDMTVNDVVLGVTQAGLSRYLSRRYGEGIKIDEKAVEQKNNDLLPKSIRLRATVLFNLRATTDIAAMGNEFGIVLLPFNIAVEDEPIDYLRRAKIVMDKKKASFEPFYVSFFLNAVGKLFGAKTAMKSGITIAFNTTLLFSNMPGPQEEIEFTWGNEISYIAPTCYGMPNALMIHVISYVDKLTFVLSVDEETIPDPLSLCDDFEQSLRLIKASVLAKKFT